MRTILTAVALVVLTALTAAMPAAAFAAGPAAADAVTADLDGTPIGLSEIADWHCHDRDFPAIHCFATDRELERALAIADLSAPMSAEAVTYVVVYAQPGYSGASLAISQDYDTLALVGWNDRIRSFHAVNSELGRFWTDWFATGSRLDFCCNATVPSLSATFDLQITSVYRR